MKRFIEGEDRSQVTLLAECLDDYIAEDNPVRVVDAFVEELDLCATQHVRFGHTPRGGTRGQRSAQASQVNSEELACSGSHRQSPLVETLTPQNAAGSLSCPTSMEAVLNRE